MVLVLALAVTWAGCKRSAEGSRPLILITLDTTRADSLGAFGGRAGLTPNLDRLASQARRFQMTRAVAPLTLPSHASMHTGLVPPRHTLRDNGLAALPAEAVTLAEHAKRLGLQTGAFVSAAVLDPAFGLDQGFDVYDSPGRNTPGKTSAYAERPANETLAAAAQWLNQRQGPFFLWVHLFDPHAPHQAPPAFRQRAGGDSYLAEVSWMDQCLGTFFDSLSANGVLDRALLIVVGDHGESLGEHGEPTHSSYVYDSTLRVPCFVRWPDATNEGDHPGLASVVDVYSTGLDWWGMPADPEVDGVSWLGQGPGQGRGLYFESYYGFLNFGWSPLAGWVDGEGKWIVGGMEQYFDPSQDPKESNDLAPQRTQARLRARAQIDALMTRKALTRSRTTSIDPKVKEQVAHLGYAASALADQVMPHPLAKVERPAPAASADELQRFTEAIRLGDTGDRKRAIEALRAVVAVNGLHNVAQSYLGTYLVLERRFAEALPVLENLAARGAVRANYLNNLGFCKEQAGQMEAALALYRRALELDSEHAFAKQNAQRLELQIQGRR